MPEITTPLRGPPQAAKRRQILAGARDVFGELGFERASVDLIAARAGVSKATVYNHFEDKKGLFVACLLEEGDDMRAELQRACVGGARGDAEDELQALGQKIMAVFLSPAVSRLFRHTIAEVGRFPEIGRMVFERGTVPLQDAIASVLVRFHERGPLRIDDARSAAIQFIALCQGDLMVRARLGVLEPPFDAQVRETVERGVRTFVRAYRA
jgi:TetR/AcrR family transcriptional repressor of mexJK operon